MPSILINTIDADVRASASLIQGVDILLGKTPLPPSDFVFEFLETYYMPMGDEQLPPAFIANFGDQTSRLIDIGSNPDPLIAELTEQILSLKSEAQTKLYMNRLKLTFEALCNLSLLCSVAEDRLTPTVDYIDKFCELVTPDTPHTEENLRRILAVTIVDTFLSSLLMLPNKVVTIIQVISDITDLTIPSLPYLELIREDSYKLNLDVSLSTSSNVSKTAPYDEQPKIYVPSQMQTRLLKTLQVYTPKEQHESLELLLLKGTSEDRIWIKQKAASLAYIFKQAREASSYPILGTMNEVAIWLSTYFNWGKNHPRPVSFDTTYKVLRGNTDVTKANQIRLML